MQSNFIKIIESYFSDKDDDSIILSNSNLDTLPPYTLITFDEKDTIVNINDISFDILPKRIILIIEFKSIEELEPLNKWLHSSRYSMIVTNMILYYNICTHIYTYISREYAFE